MDSKILYMYILMVLALIIGFLIGKVLRRSAYKERYANRFDELQYIEEEKYEKLHKSELELKSLQNLHLDYKDSFRIKNERVDSYVDKINLLTEEMETLTKSNEILMQNIPIVDEEINEALFDLEKVKNARDVFLKEIDSLHHVENDIRELNRDIESIEMLLQPAIEKKNNLSLNIEKLTKTIEQKERLLAKLNLEESEIKENYFQKKSSIERELQKSRRKEQEYHERLQKIEEKIIDGKEILRSDFSGLIDDDLSSSRWFSPLKNLFKGKK